GSEHGVMLSTDGSEGDADDQASIIWSPDSRRISAYRVRPGYQRMVHYVLSSPTDQLQPRDSTLYYNKPGDVLDVDQPVLFDLTSHRQFVIDDSLVPNAYDVTALAWRHNSQAVTFEYNQRGHQVYRVIEVDANTGKARAVIDEQSKTFIYYNAANNSMSPGDTYINSMNDGKEIIWMSQRDGWKHLYLYDGATGQVKNQITKGQWQVHYVERVD